MINQPTFFMKDEKISGEFMRNPEFFNPFDTAQKNVKKQNFLDRKSSSKYEKSPHQTSQKKKENKIKQAKELLAQKLKEVTTIHFHQPIIHQNNLLQDKTDQAKQQDKAWDCHLNPISKLTKQPFVRSKTCDQLRKQYSLKKQRKRNNSASKYSTPITNHCQREVRSTGVNSKDVYTGQSAWLQGSQAHQSKQRPNKVDTQEFTLDPFGKNMIETFDEDQIKKISQNLNKKKYKQKYLTCKKQSLEAGQQEQPYTRTQFIKYPFKINTIVNRDEQNTRSPQKYQNKGNDTSASNLLLNDSNGQPVKFTPKLERYFQQEKSKSSGFKPASSNNNFQNISIKTRINQQRQKYQYQNQQGLKPARDDSFEYSDEQAQCQEASYEPQFSDSLRQNVRSTHYPNQSVTNLFMTNTILEEKLKLKELQIEELNRNYFQLKTELIHVKNKQNQNIRYSPGQSFNIGRSKLSNQNYLTNLQLENVHLSDIQNSESQIVNLNGQISPLPSPKFCEGIEEEFERQRQVKPEWTYEIRRFEEPSAKQRFNKKKELFSSDMSEKISEEFDSEQIYMATYEPPSNKLSQRYIFKKSHFNQNTSKEPSNVANKRDSIVYTLAQQPEQIQSQQKRQTEISQLSNDSKHRSSYVASQEMLLQPVAQSISNESEKLNSLSPIKINSETQRNENGSLRHHSFRTSMTKSENKIMDDSMRKFDYYLTPQKDENTQNQFNYQSLQKKENNSGLFEKAFSTMRKRKAHLDKSEGKYSESHQYSNSSSKKQEMIDPIIQNNIQ